eukprot:14632444-Heterocapsa_arctica.AAC.1
MPHHGMTPYERVRGRTYHGQIYKFGESVMIKLPEVQEMPKLSARWEKGAWIGKSSDGDEH